MTESGKACKRSDATMASYLHAYTITFSEEGLKDESDITNKKHWCEKLTESAC